MYQEGGIGGTRKEVVLPKDGDSGRHGDGMRIMYGVGNTMCNEKKVV